MSHKIGGLGLLALLMATTVSISQAKEKNAPPSQKIAKGSKVFVAPIADGYDRYLKNAIASKKVPVEIVANREQAEYEITGTAESQKAGAAKKTIMGNWHSREATFFASPAGINTGAAATRRKEPCFIPRRLASSI